MIKELDLEEPKGWVCEGVGEMKLIRFLNHTFLHVLDEVATVSDYTIFYGFLTTSLMNINYFFWNNKGCLNVSNIFI